jgi:hypothetical protein
MSQPDLPAVKGHEQSAGVFVVVIVQNAIRTLCERLSRERPTRLDMLLTQT